MLTLAGGINVRNTAYAGGAAGDGAADDTAAIQAALNAASPGRPVIVPAGTYKVSAPLTVPAGVELAGSYGPKHLLAGATLAMAPGFTGSGVILLPAGSSEQRVTRICIDASAAPPGTAIGVDGNASAVPYVQLTDMLMSGAGLVNGVSQQGSSNGWRCRNVVVSGCSATGFLIQSPDNHWDTCQALGCGTHGWSVVNAWNGHFNTCRADWNGDYGFYIQGAWGTGAGSGGCQFDSCSTDRNAVYGVLVTATGNAPVLFTSLATRRDGSAGSGAGLRVSNATIPVIVSGWQCYPGVNDDGTGTASPATGLSLNGTNTYVAVSDALIHAITTPVSGSSGLANRNVATRTGTTGSPSAISLLADTA